MQSMKKTLHAIDEAIADYTRTKMEEELSKNIEDVIFFSSYTIRPSVFKKATQKLKSKLKAKEYSELFLWENEAKNLIKTYHLCITPNEKALFEYLLISLCRAQIKINEAILSRFKSVHQKAHNWEHVLTRAKEIQLLLEA